MRILDISISEQRCQVLDNGKVIFDASVSTALKGVGQLKGSGCTPLGWHQIRACIGEKQPVNSVFVARRPTGEIYTKELGQQFPQRDWVLTRILWLSGLESGKNRLGNVDTMQRYIYIHGCPDELPMGNPLSHGCIRIHNEAVLSLFEMVKPSLKVWVHQ